MSFLNEIVKQMYVDPELLEMLSAEHREILFRKIREEQVKRWAKKDKEMEKKKKYFAKKRTPRKINFRLGANGEPWVWVMGEHPSDLSYEELVYHREQEEQERERLNELQDLKEAEELAKQEARGLLSLAKMIEEGENGDTDETDGAGDVGGGLSLEDKDSESGAPRHLRIQLARTESSQIEASPHLGKKLTESELKKEEEERKRTITRRASQIGSTQEQLNDFEKKRAEELFDTLMRAKRIAKKRAAEMSKNVEARWEESEKKAKEYEKTRRNSFKKARELIEKNPQISDKIIEQIAANTTAKRKLAVRKPIRPAPAPPKPLLRFSSFVRPGTAPKTPAHVVKWFRDSEAPKGVGREKDGSISVWFHGKLNREASEKVLESKPNGSYLVRLSTRIWGFTVSVKSYCGCKHYLIDASRGQYHFMGPKQQQFNSLSSLLRFYRVNPVTWAGQEVLLLPVGSEEDDLSAFEGLYDDDDTLSELGESGSYL